ncbi:MAG: sulfatase-like hydrolase/transferase [Opitutaceae bacterium]|nr:sulfatase-like hydrolase/transferase [Opitutaceae bacterium]
MKSPITSGWLIALLFALVLARVGAAESRPNIVFMYADDMRWDAIGAVQREQGNAARFPWLRTPQLDRLAQQSVRFRETFVVTSLCSPGRAGVMTSRYGHLTGVIGNSMHLPLEEITFAKHLREAGYTTAYCGKWHMRDQRERPHYDFYASFVGQGRYNDCPLLVNGKETPTKGWVDDVTTGYAIGFVEQQPKDKPFFLWLGFKSPHGPRGGDNLPERARNLYANENSRPTPNTSLSAIYLGDSDRAARKAEGPQQQEAHRDYFRHISAIDTCVGRVLDALERSGRAENTIVIMTSDNGYYLGEHGLGDKRSAYEESLRVPLLIKLAGRGAARTATNDAMVLNLDYGPTILELAGAKPLPGAQGRSFRPVLEGRTPADWRTAFFYEYFREGNFNAPTVLAMRTSTHKLVTYPGHQDWTEVMDVKGDQYETRNLASDSALRGPLKAKLDDYAKAVDFRWPQGYGPNGETAPTTKAPKAGKKKKG